MEFLQLKYFQVVARTEHMTRAAEELHIAQPSLSKTIARLEETVGVPLFDRQKRGIKLNQFGKAFLQRVERAFAELEEGQRVVADMAGLERGSIILGATTTRLLPNLFGEFLTDHPHVSFRLLNLSSSEVLDKLESGEIDLCISTPPICQPGVSCESLLKEEILLAMSPKHPFASRTSIDLKEVEHDPMISLTTDYSLREITDGFCRQAGFTPNIAFESTDPEVIYGLVKAGLGHALIPAYWKAENRMDSLVYLPIDHPVCQRTIGLSWVENRYMPVATRSFREFVVNYFSSHSNF